MIFVCLMYSHSTTLVSQAPFDIDMKNMGSCRFDFYEFIYSKSILNKINASLTQFICLSGQLNSKACIKSKRFNKFPNFQVVFLFDKDQVFSSLFSGYSA